MHWTKAIGIDALEEHYRKLADYFNAGTYAAIAELYNESSVIAATGSRKLFGGPEGAVEFWTWLATKKRVKKIRFKIHNAKILNSVRFLPRSFPGTNPGQVYYQATIEKIGYYGTITTTASPETDATFTGGGFHRDECQFGLPDDESFPF